MDSGVASLWEDWQIERYEEVCTEFAAWLGKKRADEFGEWLRRRRER
jgi:hypothetical protein